MAASEAQTIVLTEDNYKELIGKQVKVISSKASTEVKASLTPEAAMEQGCVY